MNNQNFNPRTQTKKNNSRALVAKKKEWPDLIKVFSFIITLLGVLAWIAGAAFDAGYWGVAGLESGLASKSIQQTALMGLIAAFRVWFYGAIALGLIGLSIIILGITRKKRERTNNPPTQENGIIRWLKSHLGYDATFGQIGLSVILVTYIFIACVFVPMIMWSITAHSEGRKQFTNQLCKIRSNKGPFTEIKIGDGKILSGYVIDRTENEALLLDSKYLHFLKMQDKARLQYSFNLPDIDCSAK